METCAPAAESLSKIKNEVNTMNMDDLKMRIEHDTGVPAALLTGETAEECIVQAKALLALKRDYSYQPAQKTTREQFADWMRGQLGEEPPQDTTTAALEAIARDAAEEAGRYPIVADAGEVDAGPAPRSTSEQFAEWFAQKTAWKP